MFFVVCPRCLSLFLLVVPSLVLPTLPLPSAPWLHVLGLAVDRAQRRIGLGARLVQSALQMAEQQHARAALLHVRVIFFGAGRTWRRLLGKIRGGNCEVGNFCVYVSMYDRHMKKV